MDSLAERALMTTFRWQARNAMKLGDEHGPILPAPPKKGRTSLYVHVPFCQVLCPFCSFHRVQFRDEKANRYFAALRQELRLYAQAGFRFTSLYVGGGTPTCAVDELVETLHLIRELFGPMEVSVETNPGDLRVPVLEKLRAAGVGRLSVGVQSFDDALLKEMDRFEKYGAAAKVIDQLDTAAPYFPTLNVDMIYNLPHQDEASLERDLEVLLGLKANQVSFYPLMTAKASEAKMKASMGLPPSGRVGAYYQRYLQRLRPAFVPQTAWCFSRNKTAIDEYIVNAEHYVGVGSGAFSYLDGTLYATTFSLNHYVERVGKGLTGITGRKLLTPAEQMKNTFLTHLFGLELSKAEMQERWDGRFESTLWYAFAAMKTLGALTEDERSWKLTEKGMFYWVLMMSQFFESVNAFRETMRARIKDELDEPELRAPLPVAPGVGRGAAQPVP